MKVIVNTDIVGALKCIECGWCLCPIDADNVMGCINPNCDQFNVLCELPDELTVELPEVE